jgi:hypothetical protein
MSERSDEYIKGYNTCAAESAAEIAALKAERDRLRAALEDIIDLGSYRDTEGLVVGIARRALEGK